MNISVSLDVVTCKYFKNGKINGITSTPSATVVCDNDKNYEQFRHRVGGPGFAFVIPIKLIHNCILTNICIWVGHPTYQSKPDKLSLPLQAYEYFYAEFRDNDLTCLEFLDRESSNLFKELKHSNNCGIITLSKLEEAIIKLINLGGKDPYNQNE